jgi:type II secretory pathway pseudopilin PulG
LSLVEALLVVAVLAIVATVVLPDLDEIRRAAALGAASSQLKGLLYRCRADAVMNRRATATVFEQRTDGSWRCFIAVDGDGDGIRSRDIRALIDPVVGEILHFEAGGAGLGILQGEFVPDPSGRGRLRGNLSDPVRAGRGNMITFTPRGTATPASIYLTDYRARMRVLRIYGGTGRVISRVWRSGWPEWRNSGM